MTTYGLEECRPPDMIPPDVNVIPVPRMNYRVYDRLMRLWTTPITNGNGMLLT